jgi:hypothetical protein
MCQSPPFLYNVVYKKALAAEQRGLLEEAAFRLTHRRSLAKLSYASSVSALASASGFATAILEPSRF